MKRITKVFQQWRYAPVKTSEGINLARFFLSLWLSEIASANVATKSRLTHINGRTVNKGWGGGGGEGRKGGGGGARGPTEHVFLVSLPIGWQSGGIFFSQLPCVLIQNQNKCELLSILKWKLLWLNLIVKTTRRRYLSLSLKASCYLLSAVG